MNQNATSPDALVADQLEQRRPAVFERGVAEAICGRGVMRQEQHGEREGDEGSHQ
jgi:hypothetical protein